MRPSLQGCPHDPKVVPRERRVHDDVRALDRPPQGGMVLDVQLGRLDRDATRNAGEDPSALSELVREEEGRHPPIGSEFRREGPA